MNSAFSDEKPSFGITLLTEDKFKSDVMESNEMWLVVFVDATNSLSHHISIKSEWDQAAKELRGKVNMGKVYSKDLALQFDVKSFPTIMYFPQGDKSDHSSYEIYEGEVTANGIVTWALKTLNVKLTPTPMIIGKHR